MRYDNLGFPIPAHFDPPEADGDQLPRRGGNRPHAAGPMKRAFVVIVFLGVAGAAVLGPAVFPTIRSAVVQWSLMRAIAAEGRGSLDAAITEVSRAVRWTDGEDGEILDQIWLLCWRATLRIENLDAAGGLEDVETAAAASPIDPRPLRVKSLALLVLGQPEAAMTTAQTVVALTGENDPEALNHRAYFRALAGRDLEEALADIERALVGTDGASPDLLDTRGYILHLLGRHLEAVDDLTRAIDSMQDDRRRLLMLAGHIDPDMLAYRLRSADHGLAVMHHHRALACRELGLDEQAQQDLAIAQQKGFDPARGIF
jgi:tetratricopeptide (TPR) repeat protein